MRAIRLIVLAMLISGLAPVVEAGALEKLTKWMSGSFSSAAQAAEDDSYFDIRLEMVPIWTARTDGKWLYVEQAAASNLDRPYRQRIYHVTLDDDGRFRSTVYELPEPLSLAGAWREPSRFDALGPDDLTLREGCAVILARESRKRFSGSTVEKECKSSLRGASYATSKVTVTRKAIESWDQGFDAGDTQVWGAEKGPYVFVKN